MMENGSGNGTNNVSDVIAQDRFMFVLHSVVPVLFGVITLSGLVGNGLVIYVIVTRERMRTVTNLLLLNLAIADLAFVVVVPPFTAYQTVAEWWPFGDVPCRLLHYLVNVTAYVTVYTLVAVTVMRYLTIVHAARTARYRTPRVTVGVIIGIWTALSVLNAPVIASYHVQLGETGLPECDIDSYEVGRGLFGTFFVFGYALPLTVIGALSVSILINIRRQRACASAGVRRTKSFRRKQAISRLLVLVVALFAVLWLPVHIHLLIAFFGRISTDPWYLAMSILWQCLAYSNSCVNPIVYNHTSRDFREAFHCAFRSCIGRRSRRRDSSGRLEASTRAVSAVDRSAVGEQWSMEAGPHDVDGVLPADLGDLPRQQHPNHDDVDKLSNCSNRVYLED